MEDRDRILDYTKPVRLPDDCGKNRKNFTQGYFYREIGRYKNAVPSEFQWAAEDKLINKATYEELKCQLPDSSRSTFLMVFSPDGKKVASTHGNHNVYVTDLRTGKNIQTLSGHPRTPWCIAFHPSSNQILASGCLGGQVRVWDLHGGSEVWTAESQTVIASIAFHPVDRMLVIATYNELHFWDWSQPEPFAKCSTKSGREKVRYVSFDRLGNKLITGIANPASVPSQWDRINMVNCQPPMTSTTTTTTTSASNLNSMPTVTVATSQPSTHQRSLISWYRNFMNQLVNMSRNTPTTDRGTDPMDLLDLRTSGNNSESSTTNPSPSTSNPQAHPSSPLRFKITRPSSSSYRSLTERILLHSSVRRRNLTRTLLSRNSLSSTTTTTTTTTSSTSISQNSLFTTPSSSNSTLPSSSSSTRLRRCAFSFSPTARSWCLTISPESTASLFSSRNSSTSTSSSGAVTNPTYSTYSDRGILSTRESASSTTERPDPSRVRPYRLLFDDMDDFRSVSQRGSNLEREENWSNPIPSSSSSSEQTEILRSPMRNASENSPERPNYSNRDVTGNSEEEGSERGLRRPTSSLFSRRWESESANSNQYNSSFGGESSGGNEFSRNNRLSSIIQLTPVDLRNVSPVRRFREDANSDGELTVNSRRENQPLSQSLMHPRPLPRFQVRSRLVQDQQSQLHLIANRETHGLNLQNNQSLRRQLSFRPGGQFVLSRHSNSPFQPRVPHHIDSPTQADSPTAMKSNTSILRPEIPSLRSSFSTSVSSNSTEGASTTSSSSANPFSLNSVASNLSFNGEGTSRQLPEQINRRLFDRVKMMLRDRIRNSSENASVDSTVNYSRISGESESETRNLNTSVESEERNETRGLLGPRGADPMLSSASENLDSSAETLLLPNTDTLPGNGNNSPSNNDLNFSQSEFRDTWETEGAPFSSLSMHDILNEQSPPVQESISQEATENSEQNPSTSTGNNEEADSLNSSFPEFNMRQGIQLLSLHIENMQRLCLARIEVLQLQKIRGMWEDLTNQIRYFHSTIQNRTARENSNLLGENENSNSGNDIPNIRNLAISGSPVLDTSSRSSISSESSNDASLMTGCKDLVESIVNELLVDNKTQMSSSNGSSNSGRDLTERTPGPSTSRSEPEEPQPGPSGLSTPSSSQGVRNSIFKLEYRVYKLLRDLIQKMQRRRYVREHGEGTSSGLQRQNCFRIRNSSRSRFRGHGFSRSMEDLFFCKQMMKRKYIPSSSRNRALSRSLAAICQTLENEILSNRTPQPTPSTSSADLAQPSTSTSKNTSSNDACQSCGQKKKPVKELGRQKRRSVDSHSGSGASGSASKVLKNNVGERREAPTREINDEEITPTPPDTLNSRSTDSSTNELLQQMLQTMETMLRFQRETFRRNTDLSGDRPAREEPPLSSSGDDSDSDPNDSNEHGDAFMGDLMRNFWSTRKVISNSMQNIAQLRFKTLLRFMVESLKQFFGENLINLNQVLDQQIFSLYMLLDLSLELIDLLLDQLNARSRDLERSWSTDNAEASSSQSRDRNWPASRAPSVAGNRLRDRIRNYGRSSYSSPYNASRGGDDNPRYRLSANPFLRSHSRLISSRLNTPGSSNSNHDRFSSSLSPSHYRKKRETARMSTSLPRGWYTRFNRSATQSNSGSTSTPLGNRSPIGRSFSSLCRSLRISRRYNRDEQSPDGIRSFDFEINNNSGSNNDTNNNYSLNDNRNNYNNSNNSNRNTENASNSSDISNNNYSNNNNFLNYYFPSSNNSNNNNNNNNNNSNSSENSSNNNIIIVTGLNSSNEINSSSNNVYTGSRSSNNEVNNSRQSGSNPSFLNQSSLPSLRSMELTLSRNESGDISLRDERPIFWIRYGGNNEASESSNNNENHSRVSSFTVPVVQVNDVPVSDVSMLNQPRHRPQSPVPRVPEDILRWRAWRPRFLHPRYGGPNPFDDQDSNDVPENIHYYRILSTSAGSHLGVYTLDPMIITDAPLSPLHRIQAWDFSKMNIPDISDREANGVVPECKIHNDASVDVSNDGHLLVTLLPSGRISVTTMLGVYSLDWSSLGQLLYRTSFEQNAVSVSLSPTNRHLLVGLASRPVVVRDRTNMAQIFRLEGGRPSPRGGSWQSGRGRLVHMRDLEQTRETNIMSLNCIRWAPGAGQGFVYGTNTGQLKVLR